MRNFREIATVVTIHYRIQFDAAGNIQTTGGDVLQGDQLIGLTRAWCASGMNTGNPFAGPPEEYSPENWVGAAELTERVADLELTGWYPVLRTENREWIYTLTDPVDRVEVTVQ